MTITQIVASDMDGTFLRSDHDFDHERFGKIIQSFKERGILFTAASGRPLLNLKDLFADYLDEMALVAENGALVYYKGKIIFQADPIDKDLALSIIDAIEKSPYGSSLKTIVSGLEGAFVLEGMAQEDYDFISNFYLAANRVKDYQDIDIDVIKLVAVFDEENLEEAQAWLNRTFDGVTAVTTGIESVDIILNDCHKAIGLEHLCQHLGLSPAAVTAFGDNQNDIEMLEFAGTAVATGNAREEVKAVADQVIGTCDQEAVLDYLESMLETK